MENVRVRFAPSPTGPLHIGGVRTALYNYLFAKKHNGTFILRIEDTDQNRFVPNAEQYIKDALNWSKIPYDEGPGKNEKYGPYKQSERSTIYLEHIHKLIENGHAYYAFDTQEELDILRKKAEENKETFSYDHRNRTQLNNSIKLDQNAVTKLIETGHPYVIRFKNRPGNILNLKDLIRGEIKINTDLLDDKVLMKADGLPTYHLANIVDDHLMEISHVIRGEEWLPSLALHHQLYAAFGWNQPKFAHLPLILKPIGKGKLSKRDGDKLGFPVFPLAYINPETKEETSGYKESGYFPEAFINMLALLGWNPGTEQELFNMQELIDAFDLSKVSKSGAKFNPDKSKWFNQQYMQKATYQDVKESILYNLQNNNIQPNALIDERIFELIKERASFPQDLWEMSKFFYLEPTDYDEKAFKKQWKENTSSLLKELSISLKSIPSWESEILEQTTKSFITSKEIGFGKVMAPLRLALVGNLSGPDIFQIMEIIGKEQTIQRIEYAINKI